MAMLADEMVVSSPVEDEVTEVALLGNDDFSMGMEHWTPWRAVAGAIHRSIRIGEM